MSQKDIPGPRQSNRRYPLKKTTSVFLFLILSIFFSSQPARQEQKPPGSQLAVFVKAGDSSGSGTILQPAPGDGIIIAITDHTFKSDLKEVCVKMSEKTSGTTAYVLSRGDENHDIAFLYLDSGGMANLSVVSSGATTQEKQRVFGHGFSTKGKSISRKGLLLFHLEKILLGSYDLATTLDIDKGMSGGPITDSQGRLVGMIATHSEPLWDSELMYQDRSPVEQRLSSIIDRSAMGISSKIIEKRLAQIKLSKPDSAWRSKQCSTV